jgi:hypothetical protein
MGKLMFIYKNKTLCLLVAVNAHLSKSHIFLPQLSQRFQRALSESLKLFPQLPHSSGLSLFVTKWARGQASIHPTLWALVLVGDGRLRVILGMHFLVGCFPYGGLGYELYSSLQQQNNSIRDKKYLSKQIALSLLYTSREELYFECHVTQHYRKFAWLSQPKTSLFSLLNILPCDYISDRLCGILGRVRAYTSRGPGSIPGATRFSEK